ncbi:hypothetical protein [Shewanella sp. GXUN23E]|uniref:hypothetical protein n=1 Tax=Shewanella sp. GXUN23E TaxID=3422498 RepID=UPI003D7D1531
MKKTAIGLSAGLLLGGGAIHDTPQGLVQAGKAGHSFCAAASFTQTVSQIESQLQRCFGLGIREMYAGTSHSYIERFNNPDGSVMLASATRANWHLFYQLVVEIRPTDRCPAYVDVYGMSDAWLDTSRLVEDWTKGLGLDRCD